ncbi:MAG: hypothetical protein AAB432_01760 [Patescibacteria group bacterium]
MTSKQIYTLIVLVVVVTLIIIFGRVNERRANEDGFNTQNNNPASVGVNTIPKGYSPNVPINAEPTKPKTEMAVVSANGSPNSKFNTYAITASVSGYSPNTLTVKKGDIIEINFNSVGGDYDLFSESAGFYVNNVTKNISFTASTAGTFIFECRNSCPPAGKIKGSFIVKP